MIAPRSLLVASLAFFLSAVSSFAATYTATTETQLRSYLSSAAPGDVINISGTINMTGGCLKTSKAGSSSGYITLQGGTLNWTANADRACVNIVHSYYKLQDIVIDANGKSDRGLLIENAKHGKIVRVTVKESKNEGYKIRKNSQYWYFDTCTVQDTGVDGKYGEGFYCGDANANWSTGSVADKTSYLTFNYCKAIRTMADGFDFKEGTHHIKVVNCTVDFQGRNIDTVYGNHGISTRADTIEIINTTVKNNTASNATGQGVWIGRLKAKDGNWYGSNTEIKKFTVSNIKKYLYYANTSVTLYTDYSYSSCAGLKDPASTTTATSGNPANFSQMTWSGEGGGTY